MNLSRARRQEYFKSPSLPPPRHLQAARLERIMTYEAVTSTFQRVLNGAKIVVSTLAALFV